MTIRDRIVAVSHATGRAIDKFMPWYPEVEKAEAHQAEIDRIHSQQAAASRSGTWLQADLSGTSAGTGRNSIELTGGSRSQSQLADVEIEL